jgi:predicted transcriptional regulator
LNEAYVKARYSKHYEISEEALAWLGEQAGTLQTLAEQICLERLARIREAVLA